MPTKTNTEAENARFVFKGTVQKLKATTMREISATARTAVVRVDEVIHASEVLSQYAGQDITVVVGGKKKLRKGQQSVFYSNGVLFGDSVTVEAVDHRDVEKTAAALAAADTDPVKSLEQRDLRRRFDSADVVLSGRVVAVRIPSDVVAAFASRAAADSAKRAVADSLRKLAALHPANDSTARADSGAKRTSAAETDSAARADSIRAARAARREAARRDSIRRESMRRDSIRRDSVRRDSVRRDSIRRDTSTRRDIIRRDTLQNHRR